MTVLGTKENVENKRQLCCLGLFVFQVLFGRDQLSVIKARSQETTVSGLTTIRAYDQEDQKRRRRIQRVGPSFGGGPWLFAFKHGQLLTESGDLQR